MGPLASVGSSPFRFLILITPFAPLAPVKSAVRVARAVSQFSAFQNFSFCL